MKAVLGQNCESRRQQMWLIKNNKTYGFAYRCPKCGWTSLNEKQWICRDCNVTLDEVLLKGDE